MYLNHTRTLKCLSKRDRIGGERRRGVVVVVVVDFHGAQVLSQKFHFSFSTDEKCLAEELHHS